MTNTADRAGYLAVLALGLGAVWVTLDFPPESAVFPRLVAGVLAAMGALHLVGSYVVRGKEPLSTGEDMEGGYQLSGGRRFFDSPVRFAIIFLLSLLYCVSIATVGYYTSSLVFIPLSLVALGYRRPLGMLAATTIYVAGTWLLIGIVFSRVLPPERILQLIG